MYKEIKTHSNNIVVLEIPEECFRNENYDYPDWYLYDTIYNTELVILKPPKGTSDVRIDIKYPFNKLKLLGKLSELEDNEIFSFIDYKHIVSSYNCECYRNYIEQTDDDWNKYPYINHCKTVKDSFISLLSSNNIDTNNKEYLIIQII